VRKRQNKVVPLLLADLFSLLSYLFAMNWAWKTCRKNALAYCRATSATKKKSFIKLPPGVCRQKLGCRVRLRKPEEGVRRGQQEVDRSHIENEEQVLQRRRRRRRWRRGFGIFYVFLFSSFSGQCYKTFYGRKLRIFVISQSVCPWQAFPA